jgi:hypothetical protein
MPAEAGDVSALGRRLGRWRALAMLMTLLVAAMATLLGLWRFVPESVPAALQPLELMRGMGVELPTVPSAPRPRRTPAGSQFEE